MSEQQFENILAENESLNNLITNQKINTFTKLPKKSDFDSAFIDWLSPKFYNSFTSIYNAQINAKNKSGLISIIRSEWLCNEETEHKIYDFLKPHIEKTIQQSENLKLKFNNTKDTEELVKLTNEIDEDIINYVNKVLFTKKNESIRVFKEKLTTDSIEICQILREKRMSKDVKNILISSITESFNNISLEKSQSESLNVHLSKAKSSMTISVIIGVILALFAVIRLIMRLS
ncbi:hypothetical protein [uncultured Winogradskyella sp.]|uniref:hypothetical protein n=1 Tax=uncultured Winogradskyella sp. TaxID=395353 RepID=UPI002603B0E6|nr:hypothetical protein [uncultured Winogradskyella sp.]